MAQLPFAEGLKLLEARSRLASIAIWLFIAIAVLTAACEFLEFSGVIDIEAPDPTGLSLLAALVYLGFSLVYLGSVVVVSMWIYRAHANLFAADLDELEYTPGWSVGWFFVPFANLVKPFHAMRELWNASYGSPNDFGSETPSTIRIWWGCFIAGNILSNIATRIQLSDAGPEAQMVGLVVGGTGTILTIGAAWFLLQIIREVMDGQRNHLQVSEAFA